MDHNYSHSIAQLVAEKEKHSKSILKINQAIDSLVALNGNHKVVAPTTFTNNYVAQKTKGTISVTSATIKYLTENGNLNKVRTIHREILKMGAKCKRISLQASLARLAIAGKIKRVAWGIYQGL